MNELVSIVLPDLRGGGTERISLRLAEEFVRRGFGVDIVVLRAAGELYASIPRGVHIHDLRVNRFRSALFPLRQYLKNRRPVALFARMWPLTTVAVWANLLAGRRTKVVVSDHGIVSRSPQAQGLLRGLLLRSSMRLSYPFAHAVVGVSSAVASDIAGLASLGRSSVSVIYNPAFSERADIRADIPLGASAWMSFKRRILTVGNLKKVKDHVSLVRAFAALTVHDAGLLIVGEGAERASILRIAAELGVDDRVFLPGFVFDPAPLYAAADLFVLSSTSEGFGNVIVEALQHGVPVVSTNCAGPAEILDGGRYGCLVAVGDLEGLTQAMSDALATQPEPNKLRTRAKKFTVQRAADAYLSLLHGQCSGNHESNVSR